MGLGPIRAKHGKVYVGCAAGDVKLGRIQRLTRAAADILGPFGAHMHDNPPGLGAAQNHMAAFKAQFPDGGAGTGIEVPILQGVNDGGIA